MSDIPLLGQNKPEDKEGITLPPLRTAFLVFQDYDGQWGATNDLSVLSDELSVDKMAHPDEIAAGCYSVGLDVAAQKTAAQVHMVMQQVAVAARNAALHQQVQQQLRRENR